MKNNKYFGLVWIFMLALLFACEPYMDDKPEAGFVPAPSASEMDFSITPGNDAFHYNLELISPQINGIKTISFDLGNNSKVKGESAVGYYPLPGDYTVTMTIKTNGGEASVSKSLTTTETDYSIFTSDQFVFLSGGADDLDGKTWMLDSLSSGHLGVGPAGSAGLEWWAAAPLAKQGVGVLYDDEINFKIDGFVATLTNHGQSYVKDFAKDKPGYTNGYVDDTDWVVSYDPQPGTWFVEEKNGLWYLTISSSGPLFPCFDVSAADGTYQILRLEENVLELVAIGGDGNGWHYQLIPKGYAKPSVSTELSVVEAAEPNTYDISLTNFDIPAGQSINGVTFNFGEGDPVQSDDYMAVASHTYMRAGTYAVTAVVGTSVGDLNLSQMVTVAANHPDYVPFLLSKMVMYNDFSEVAMAPVNGQDCSVTTVANPSRVYPNRSANVAFYSKTNNEWANANMQLPSGYRFDLREISVFKVKVYGKAGDQVLLKLENTDRGGNAWQTGTADLIYTIQNDNTWEIAEFDMAGNSAGWDWTGDIFTSDITTDDNFSHDFYNVLRIMLNPGVGDGTHEFYLDELSGPHVEGIKSATIN